MLGEPVLRGAVAALAAYAIAGLEAGAAQMVPRPRAVAFQADGAFVSGFFQAEIAGHGLRALIEEDAVRLVVRVVIGPGGILARLTAFAPIGPVTRGRRTGRRAQILMFARLLCGGRLRN